MKISNSKIVMHVNKLSDFKDKKLPQKISYAIAKNALILTNEYKIYETEFNKLNEQYAKYMNVNNDGTVELNANGIPMIIDDYMRNEYISKLNDLLSIEVDINLYLIDEECFNYDDTMGRYDTLSPLELIFLRSVLCKDDTNEN
jgi:hypothetical protein